MAKRLLKYDIQPASTCIGSAEYDEGTKDMNIQFASGGKTYTYPNVEKQEALDLKNSSVEGSFGKTFHYEIKPYSVANK